MANRNYFDPNKLAVYDHPGESLAEYLSEEGMSVKEFAIRTNKPEKTIHAILSGKSSITNDMAIAFEIVTRMPARYWMNKQHNYDEYLARQRERAKQESLIEWAKQFPYKEMCALGWIESANDAITQVSNLLSFFRVDSAEAWEALYCKSKLKVSFRISLKGSNNPYAISAWLRYGEILASGAEVSGEYSPTLLKAMLPTIQEIVYNQPSDFSEQIKKVCSHCGIKVIYLKHLPKAPVSGCARWIQDTPCIMLTDRYKRYDVVCFSLFHEIAHILKHGKKDVFLEGVGNELTEKEREADNFARQMLLPSAVLEDFVKAGNFGYGDILRASVKFHVNSVVLTGALIHDKVISYKTHGKLLKQQTLV